MKIYELVIAKGNFILDGDDREQECLNDVVVKAYRYEEARDAAYDHIIDPYIKLSDFHKNFQEKLLNGRNLFTIPVEEAIKIRNTVYITCSSFARSIECDVQNCHNAYVNTENDNYTYIYIQVDQDEPEIESHNKFYKIFKRETELK